jgi:hypothetical protein
MSAAMTARTPSVTIASSESATWRTEALWLLAAGVTGFATSALFSSMLALPRSWFVGAYLIVVATFLAAYVKTGRIDVVALVHQHWVRGVIGAVGFGAFMVWSMQRQPASPAPQGVDLVLALVWLGLVYSTLDALLLSIMPVVAAWRLVERLGMTATWSGRLAGSALGLVASLGVTALYHLGFAEYREAGLAAPLIGNGVMTLGYLLMANPITAWGAHVALHVASVLHGIDTTVTLPPHY